MRQIIEAGNTIARTPYLWGGGHGKWLDKGYDCSGSVSYALASAGLLNAPLDSGRLMSWGEPGPGKWVTIYTNPGHVYLVVAGVRFDTSGTRSTGSRWQKSMRGAAASSRAIHPASDALESRVMSIPSFGIQVVKKRRRRPASPPQASSTSRRRPRSSRRSPRRPPSRAPRSCSTCAS